MTLPADVYNVINKGVITEFDRKIVIDLYQPIIGNIATSLYFTLLNDLDRLEVVSDSFSHHHLQGIMHINLNDISIAKEKLEAVGLLKTYVKKEKVNNFLYILFPPISPSEFLNHPILNIVLYNNVGKHEYEKIVSFYKIPRLSLRDYEDVTHSFNDVFSSFPMNSLIANEDIRCRDKNIININHSFDFPLLISGIDKNMIHEKCFNKEIKELILNLSYVYNIDALEMQHLVKSSLNEKGLIDKESLRKNARNHYQYKNDGNLPTLIYNHQPEHLKKPVGDLSKRAKMVYTFETASPYQFIKSKYKDGKVTTRDLKIIESLLIDLKLYPGVVNVLIDYCLKVNNQKLNKNYIETIAGQWKRLQIESVEEAMELCEKEYKKTSKNKIISTTKSKKVIPEWFNKEIEKEQLTKEEQEEIEDLISSF